MSSSRLGSGLVVAARRNWLVVVVCVIVAAGTAFAFSLSASTTHEARAVITVDATTVAQNARLPKPDEVIARTQSTEFAEEIAQTCDIDADAIREDLNVFSLGHPQDRIVVTFASEDRTEAEEVARSAAVAAVEEGYRLADTVISHQRAVIEESAAALDVLEPLVDESPSTRYNVWSVRRNLYTDMYNLNFAETMFTYDDSVYVTTSSRGSVLLRSGVGGLVVGVALAAVIVAVRETWARTRE